MGQTLLIVFILLVIFAWFILGEQKSFMEKLSVLLIFLFLYGGYRYFQGDSLYTIFIEPILGFFNRS